MERENMFFKKMIYFHCTVMSEICPQAKIILHGIDENSAKTGNFGGRKI